MKRKELYEILTKTEFPVAYESFEDELPEPPYLVFVRTLTESFCADDCELYRTNHYQIELYSAYKNDEAERKVERILNQNGIICDVVDEGFIKSEGLYYVFYECSLGGE